MIDFTGINARPRFADPVSRQIAKGHASMITFSAARARSRKAPRVAITPTPKATPGRATAPSPTPEQRRVDAFEYPAEWTEKGQAAIDAARAVAPGGAGVDYPAHWAR